MSSSRHLTLAIIGCALLVAVGWVLFVWPVYLAAAANRTELKKARAECDRGTSQPQREDELDKELAGLEEKRRKNSQKQMPADGPDEDELIRALFTRRPEQPRPLQIDYAFGKPADAVPGLPHQAMPLTVKVRGTWDAIFDLVQRAESIDRLLRVSAVEVRCDHSGDNDEDLTVASADIVLDVIYKQDTVRRGGPR